MEADALLALVAPGPCARGFPCLMRAWMVAPMGRDATLDCGFRRCAYGPAGHRAKGSLRLSPHRTHPGARSAARPAGMAEAIAEKRSEPLAGGSLPLFAS